MDLITLALAKKYTNDTVNGLGTLKGSPCTISKVETVEDGTEITFQWEGNNGKTQDTKIKIKDGISVSSGSIDEKNHLIIVLSNGNKIDCGEIGVSVNRNSDSKSQNENNNIKVINLIDDIDSLKRNEYKDKIYMNKQNLLDEFFCYIKHMDSLMSMRNFLIKHEFYIKNKNDYTYYSNYTYTIADGENEILFTKISLNLKSIYFYDVDELVYTAKIPNDKSIKLRKYDFPHYYITDEKNHRKDEIITRCNIKELNRHSLADLNVIGTWVDGKNIYRQSYSKEVESTQEWKQFTKLQNVVGQIVSINACCLREDNGLIYPVGANDFSIRVASDHQTIEYIKTNGNGTINLIVEYTIE